MRVPHNSGKLLFVDNVAVNTGDASEGPLWWRMVLQVGRRTDSTYKRGFAEVSVM